MRPHRQAAVVLALALLPGLATNARAQYRRPYPVRRFEHAYEFNPYVTFNHFQDKTDLDDDFGAGIRFGYLYTPHHEIEFLLDGVSTRGAVFDTNGVFVGNSRDDLTNFQAAYVFNFTKRDVVPYVTAGLGFLHTHDDILGNETNGVVGLGGGVRFFLGRALYARFEARSNFFTGKGTVFADREEFHNNVFAFGIGWRIGVP